MDLYLTGLLIRGLIVLATFCLLVIAAALLARREKRRASKFAADTPGSPGGKPAAMDGAPRYRADCAQLGANDSEASVSVMHRRAA